MRKSFIAFGISIIANLTTTYLPINSYAHLEVPEYAKWGKVAIKEAHSKFPNAKVIDYLYKGSESIGNSSIVKFKIWLKEGDKEFGVYVTITYKKGTENLLNIEIKKTDR